jgi:predicted O-methyltransferase YrrM
METVYPNWFKQTAQENFEHYLQEFIGKENLSFLQIGAFTGDASVWMLDNILTHESSTLTDVDTWLGSEEAAHKDIDFTDVKIEYLNKTNRPNRYWFNGKSVDFFSDLEGKKYDFIYIDGDHTASGVLDDAVMAWYALKPKGIMAFDDYTWEHEGGTHLTPRPSINFFISIKKDQLEILEVNSQVWIRKL